MDLICATGLHTKTFNLPPARSSIINLKRNNARRCRVKVLNMSIREGFNMKIPLQQQRPLFLQDQISTVHRNLDLAFPHRRHDRDVVAHIIPFKREHRRSPPPDLPSYLLDKRIIYVGWPLYWSVFELIVGELIYLSEVDDRTPAYMYINSTGTSKYGIKHGEESQAIALHDIMRTCTFPIYTLAIGNAWGDAALLLAAGARGHRAALPSASIMIKQPITAVQGQATDIDIARDEVTDSKQIMVKLWARHTGHSIQKIERDIRRPKYFSPEEAIKYGLIDKILYPKGKKKFSTEDSPDSLASHAELI